MGQKASQIYLVWASEMSAGLSRSCRESFLVCWQWMCCSAVENGSQVSRHTLDYIMSTCSCERRCWCEIRVRSGQWWVTALSAWLIMHLRPLWLMIIKKPIMNLQHNPALSFKQQLLLYSVLLKWFCFRMQISVPNMRCIHIGMNCLSQICNINNMTVLWMHNQHENKHWVNIVLVLNLQS